MSMNPEMDAAVTTAELPFTDAEEVAILSQLRLPPGKDRLSIQRTSSFSERGCRDVTRYGAGNSYPYGFSGGPMTVCGNAH